MIRGIGGIVKTFSNGEQVPHPEDLVVKRESEDGSIQVPVLGMIRYKVPQGCKMRSIESFRLVVGLGVVRCSEHALNYQERTHTYWKNRIVNAFPLSEKRHCWGTICQHTMS